MKHQGNCYRIIGGKKLMNYCDLIMGDDENNKVVQEAKLAYHTVRKIKHPSGYYQLFVSDNKPIVAELVNVGGKRISKTIEVKDMATLHKEIGKLLVSKKWSLNEFEEDWYEVDAYAELGHLNAGTVHIISK